MLDPINNQLTLLLTGALGMALLGSLHCAGMCGAIAALNPNRKSQFLYQSGRLMSYLALGFGSGLLGHRFYLNIEKHQDYISALIILLLGAMILFFGDFGPWLSKTVWRLIPTRSLTLRHLLLGLANGLLPCHFLYGFLAMSAASGKPGVGALIMMMLWLGSSPALFAFSFFGAHLSHFSKTYPRSVRGLQLVLFIALIFNLVAHHLKDIS